MDEEILPSEMMSLSIDELKAVEILVFLHKFATLPQQKKTFFGTCLIESSNENFIVFCYANVKKFN